MIRNYFKSGLRSLLREKSYSLINVLGLSIGITCCLVLGLYLHYELSYDRHNLKHEQVYRVTNELRINENVDYAAITSTQLAPLLLEQYSEVEDAVRFQSMPQPSYLLRSDYEQAFYWEKLYLADNSVFNIFSHEIIYGDPDTALVDPASMAVSESFARRYFGDRNPLGETIYTDINSYRIDLVFADLPANSHLKYDALLSYNRLPVPEGAERREALWNINVFTYVLMSSNYDIAAFSELSESFYENNMAALARELNVNARMDLYLEPLTEVHLGSTTTFDLPRGNAFYVYAFAAIALFVLAVACINYMNLATARSTKRSKEVGMRKVMGATRSQLVGQFVGESIFYVVISLCLALLFTWAVLNITAVPALLDAPLDAGILLDPMTLGLLALGSIILGAASGLYPAVYLSSIAPVAAFRGSKGSGNSGNGIRQFLVLVQFVISIAVIASTLLMLAQMRYVQNLPLGFDKQNKLVVRVAGADQVERLPSLINELENLPGILGAAHTGHVPGQQTGLTAVRVEDNNGALQDQTLSVINTRPDFVKVMGMQLLEGRDFDRNRDNDAGNTVLVNEALVTKMGWETALGKRLQQMGPEAQEMEVIGVLEDFHFAGLQHEVVPVFLVDWSPDFSEMGETDRGTYSEQLIVDVNDNALQSTITALRDRWVEFDPAHPFRYSLLEEDLDALYGSEQRLMSLIGLFALVCIFISCMGLFGLSAFNTAQRAREIGIRKVLGASASGIIVLLFRNLLVLVAAAAAVASVVSFLAISEWLRGFYYRIDLLGPNVALFLIAAMLAIAVAFLTMAAQSYRTARANPVRALRQE